MKMKIKIFVTEILAILLISFCSIMVFLNVLFPKPIIKDRMVKIFDNHKDTITVVAEYFDSLEYDSINVSRSSQKGKMYVSTGNSVGEYIEIPDEKMSAAVSKLMRRGFQGINKSGNGVYFAKWDNMDGERGVVFLLNGLELENEYITIFEPLSEDNWYFYEEMMK